MAEKYLEFPQAVRSLSRWQMKSIPLLVLSFIPLGGFIFAIVWGMKRGSKVENQPLNRKFQASDYNTLNNCLTVIGIFHALVGYCIRKLMTRVAAQFRTRAFLDKSVSSAQLLNSLPGSPDHKLFFKSPISQIILCIGLFSGALSIGGGILYKQGIFFSTFDNHENATYPYTFMTNCSTDLVNCLGNKYLKYGVGLQQAKNPSPFSKGVETISGSNSLRLTFVPAPTVQLRSPTKNITRIRARTFAMVADYRNTTSGEVLLEPHRWVRASDNATSIQLTFHGGDGLDWSISGNHSQGSKQTVRGMTRYCVVECEWSSVEGSLILESYRLNETTDCAPLRLGSWSNDTAIDITKALFSDIRDVHWVPDVFPQPAHDILDSAYVVPTMYAVVVLGGWDGLWEKLVNDTFLETPLTGSLTCSLTFSSLAIETNSRFVAYLFILSMIFIAHWISGYMDPKAFVTEWAPLWFGLLPESDQEDIREQIRDNLGLEGLEEIGSRYVALHSWRVWKSKYVALQS